MIPQGFEIVRQVFPPDELGKAFGRFGPVIGGSAVPGPVLGGFLVGTGWRLIFLVNVPLGLIAVATGFKLPPESRARVRPAFDAVGAVLVGFGVVERRRERRGLSPLVTTSLFSKRAFSAGLLTALVFFAGMIGLMFTFSLYLQIGNGLSAVAAGVGFIPWALGTAVGAGLGAGLLAPRFGRRVLHGGLVVMAAGIAGMLAVVGSAEHHHVALWALAGPLFAAGVGMGAMLSPLFSFVLAGVDDDEVGSASRILNAVQQLAGAAGVALIGTLFFSVADQHGLSVASRALGRARSDPRLRAARLPAPTRPATRRGALDG
jgi:MFS family permease